MTAADRAVSILRAGLKSPSLRQIETEIHGERKGCNPFAHPNRNEFARWLNDRPFPENHPPSLITGKPGHGRAKSYGTWLHDHNHPEFVRQFEEWRKTQ